MAEPGGNIDEANARVERAEDQDDETRLRSLEQLHADLEAELERDLPAAEPKSGS